MINENTAIYCNNSTVMYLYSVSKGLSLRRFLIRNIITNKVHKNNKTNLNKNTTH